MENSVHKATCKLNLVIVGSAYSGKSCLAHRFVHGYYDGCIQPGMQDYHTSRHDVNVLINIVPGGMPIDSYRWCFRNAQGFLLVYDMMDRKSFEDLVFWYNDITQCNESSVPIVLVGAKADEKLNRHAQRRRDFSEELEFAEQYGLAGFMETSAMTGANVEEAFDLLILKAVENLSIISIMKEAICHILLKERRASWSIPYVKMSQMDIPRGQLLTKVGNLLHIRGKKDVSFQYDAKNPDVSPIYCVAKYARLEAIATAEETFNVFTTSGWLDWGTNVRKGESVYIRIPMKDKAEDCCSTACVRYIGCLIADQPGTIFGVEITDSRYYGCGTTDGTFKRVRHFTCPDNNGLFLSLASVARQPEWLNLQYFSAMAEYEAKRLYEEAVKQGSVQMSIIKCLVLGIAGVGKTHLKRLLLSENTDGLTGRVSTGLADNPVQAIVGSVKSILAGVDENDTGRWEVMDDTKLMEVLANAYQVAPPPPTVVIPPPSVPILPPIIPILPPTIPMATEIHVLPQPAHQATASVIPYPVSHVKSPPLIDGKTAADKVFIDVFKNKNKSDAKLLNMKVNLVQFIDSGGQPQFLELLPAFVQDISAILFAVNLSESLDHCPEVYYYGQDGQPVGRPYKSPSSHKQVLEQCVRASHARDVHPKVFVVGTHRDKERRWWWWSEKIEEKDTIVRTVINSESLICKSGNEAIWDVNCKTPDSTDKDVASKLRKAIVAHCSKDIVLPMKWYVLEMQIRISAPQGVLSLSKCLELAQRLGMDEQGLQAALLCMVRFNLFLWYHTVPGLRDVVFCDPQVILKIITDLVHAKHELAGDDVTEWLGSEGVKGDWCTRFRDHAIVSHDFLTHKYFRKNFDGAGVFTVEHFTALMSHLFTMVPLEGGEYLMPALLDPLSRDKICRRKGLVDPLLVCFPHECAPYGVFSCLVAYLQKKCPFVERNKVPTCLYKNCVSFKYRKFPAKFTIIDSVAYIEVHLDEGDAGKACPRIRRLVHKGIKKCAEVLHYSEWKDLKNGFICSNRSCRRVATPYEEELSKATCSHCSNDMSLTFKHTAWLTEERTSDKATPTSGKAPPSLSQELCDDHCTQLLKLTHKAADRWKDIGRKLGFEEEELDRIVRELGRHGDDDYYAAMVRRWLDWAPPRHSCPTVPALADALRAAGKERLANILEEELLCAGEGEGH